MNLKYLSIESARKICIVCVLERLSYYPSRKSEKEAWYCSPLRTETHPSFNVSLLKNLWYDFGIGKGGNVIDLVMLLLNIPFKEAIAFLSGAEGSFSFSPETSSGKVVNNEIEIIQVKTITHPALVTFLESRLISLEIASNFCREVHFLLKGKNYFSLGLENHLGGVELRNKYFKGSSFPKSYSCLKKGSKRLLITEGMFDFLSLATLEKELVESSDCIILNSLAFLEKVQPFFFGYKSIHAYLDNDLAGDRATRQLLNSFDQVIDERESYKSFKDLNEKLSIKNNLIKSKK